MATTDDKKFLNMRGLQTLWNNICTLVVNAINTSLNNFIGSEKGTAGGLASLGTDGKVPAAQLPPHYDNVVRFDGIKPLSNRIYDMGSYSDNLPTDEQEAAEQIFYSAIMERFYCKLLNEEVGGEDEYEPEYETNDTSEENISANGGISTYTVMLQCSSSWPGMEQWCGADGKPKPRTLYVDLDGNAYTYRNGTLCQLATQAAVTTAVAAETTAREQADTALRAALAGIVTDHPAAELTANSSFWLETPGGTMLNAETFAAATDPQVHINIPDDYLHLGKFAVSKGDRLYLTTDSFDGKSNCQWALVDADEKPYKAAFGDDTQASGLHLQEEIVADKDGWLYTQYLGWHQPTYTFALRVVHALAAAMATLEATVESLANRVSALENAQGRQGGVTLEEEEPLE